MGSFGGLVVAGISLAATWWGAKRASPSAPAAAVPEAVDARYPGASRQPRGNPANTILAVNGIDRVPAAARAALLDLAAELNIPVDSLAAIIASESGWNPAALNPLPAAGLIQLTLGAKLPPFDTKEEIRAITTWPAERQIREVVRPYYVRFGAAVRGATPGVLYLANFLPARLGQPESTVLGDASAPEGSFVRKVYDLNKGLDVDKNGRITIGDVYAAAARVVTAARGKRITVEGKVIDGPKTDKPPPAQAPAPGSNARAPSVLEALDAGRRLRSPIWVPVPLEDGDAALVTGDALTVELEGEWLRLPVSFDDTMQLARRLQAVPLSVEISDRSWAAAEVKLAPVGLVSTAEDSKRMNTLDFVRRHNRNVERQLGDGALCRDLGKDWVLDKRLSSAAALNYGWRTQKGVPLQPLGGAHDAHHRDYSQVCVLAARRTRSGADLLERYARQGVPTRYLESLQ